MTGATHFIEVWRGESGNIYTECIKHISWFRIAKEITVYMGGTTLFIWEIKLKNTKQ